MPLRDSYHIVDVSLGFIVLNCGHKHANGLNCIRGPMVSMMCEGPEPKPSTETSRAKAGRRGRRRVQELQKTKAGGST